MSRAILAVFAGLILSGGLLHAQETPPAAEPVGASAWSVRGGAPAAPIERTLTAAEVLAQAELEQVDAEEAVDVDLDVRSADDEIWQEIEIRTDMPGSFMIELDEIKFDKFYEVMQFSGSAQRVPMSLLECVSFALQFNQDIEIAELDPLRADGGIMSARGEFDPVLSGTATYSESKATASSQTVAFGGITAIESYTTDFNVSLQGKLSWGTQYGVTLNLNDQEDTFNRFIEEWSGGLTLSLSQPLLRGRGRTVNLARIRQARNNRTISEAALHATVMTTIGDVIKAYWDLVGATESLRVREKSMDNAERLLDITERRLEIGTAAPQDVIQAKAGLATRQSDLVSATAQVADAADRLKRLLNFKDKGYLSDAALYPTDRPSPQARDIHLGDSIELAMNNRPELIQAELRIANAEISRKTAKNDMLPQVDVSGSVTQGARGHFPSDVFDGIRNRTDHSFSVSVNGSMPVRNRTARGQYHSAQIDVRDAEHQFERIRQDLVLSIRNAARAVETNRILIESNRQTRLVQEVNLKAEEERLRLGLTTNYRVLEVEEDLTTAEVQELQALINLERSLVDLALAEGTLLAGLGINFEAPAPERTISFFNSVLPWTP